MTTPLGFGALSQRRLLCVLSASLLSVTAQAATLTRDNGAAVGDNQNSQTAGANGPVLLQDVQLLQKLQRFDREGLELTYHAHRLFLVTDEVGGCSVNQHG